MVLALASPLRAETEVGSTFLLDFYVGSSRSNLADELGRGGYELADGTFVDLDQWYASRWTDTTLLLLTQVGRNAGIIWGASTGEAGEKYDIDPALHLGFIYQYQLARQTWLTVKATALFGGNLTEKPCTADYGDIGGVQQVNCRLAAEPIPPAETLQYLAREPGRNDSRITVILEHRF